MYIYNNMSHAPYSKAPYHIENIGYRRIDFILRVFVLILSWLSMRYPFELVLNVAL